MQNGAEMLGRAWIKTGLGWGVKCEDKHSYARSGLLMSITTWFERQPGKSTMWLFHPNPDSVATDSFGNWTVGVDVLCQVVLKNICKKMKLNKGQS